jgi:hypothetical protein
MSSTRALSNAPRISTLQPAQAIHIQAANFMKKFRPAFFAFGRNPPRPALLCFCCAGLFVFATSHSFAGELPETPQVGQPQPIQTPAPVQVTPAQVPAPLPGSISFNQQNKETAKRVYQLVREIQESEFRPEANFSAITKLQETVVQTDFSTLDAVADYVRDSLTLNTLRSKDIKTQQANSGKNATQGEKQSGFSSSINPSTIAFGADRKQTATEKHEDEASSGLSISSQNDGAVLDRARQQQATSYGKLLNELKRAGFPRPIDAKLLYGKWKWRCTEDAATYEFDFKPDGSVFVRLNADNPSIWARHGFANRGRGEWTLDYRSLSLKLNDANLAGFGKQFPLIFFAGKEISMVNEEKIILACDEDNELKRIGDVPKK